MPQGRGNMGLGSILSLLLDPTGPLTRNIENRIETSMINSRFAPIRWVGQGLRGYSNLERAGEQAINNFGDRIAMGASDRTGIGVGSGTGRAYSRYMEELMRGDPGYSGEGRGDGGRGPMGAPMPNQYLPSSLPSRDIGYRPSWMGAGTWPGSEQGQRGNPLYGQGEGMMRMPDAAPARPSGARWGEVLAQRTGNTANDRALESMAEGLMGRDTLSIQRGLAQQARQMMARMFEGEEQ